MYIFFKELILEVNAYDDLNLSNLTTGTKSTSPYNTSPSLFNALLENNSDVKETDKKSPFQALSDSSQNLETLKEKADKTTTAIEERKNDLMQTADTSNTHDELILILELRKLQAS